MLNRPLRHTIIKNADASCNTWRKGWLYIIINRKSTFTMERAKGNPLVLVNYLIHSKLICINLNSFKLY